VTTFAFVAAERANHAVSTLCRVVGASVSGFYAWLRAIPSRQNRTEAEAALRGHISRIFAAKRRVYGAPRIHAELRREGHRHARRRIERLMRDMGLQAQRGRRRRPHTTDSRHDLPIAPNLLGRSFVAERPDTVWLADISYIPTDEGFLYLAALKDLATRQIVGWSMAEHLKAGLCIDALVMALQRCRPPRGLIHHSDRGSQYASGPYLRQSQPRGDGLITNDKFCFVRHGRLLLTWSRVPFGPDRPSSEPPRAASEGSHPLGAHHDEATLVDRDAGLDPASGGAAALGPRLPSGPAHGCQASRRDRHRHRGTAHAQGEPPCRP